MRIRDCVRRLPAVLIAGTTLFGSMDAAEAQVGESAGEGPRFLVAVADRPQPVEVDASKVALLRKRVTLDIEDAPLTIVLAEIARQAGIEFVYGADAPGLDHRVTLQAKEITLAAALTEVLLDAGMDVLVSSSRHATLVPRPKPAPAPPLATVTGQVIDSATDEPIDAAQVFVVGAQLGSLTDTSGRYSVAGVPSGEHEVRVRTLGYREQSRMVSVPASGTVTVDFALVLEPTRLDELVVTATGEQRRVEIGNVIETIDVEDVVATAPVTSFSDVLSGRVAGVQVLQPGGLTGASPQINIRGLSSVTLSSQPLLIIDGVRVENSAAGRTAYATLSGRLNDLVPENIASIEIVKGPSAATLYGTDAANGVIVVTTKRGSEGPARWSAYAEAGVITFDVDRVLDSYFPWGHTLDGTNRNVRCVLLQVAAGSCMQDSLTTFNPLKHPETTPIGTGHRQVHGVQVSGGSDRVSYFLSGGYDQEVGYLKLPQVDREVIEALRGGAGLLEEELRPNALEKYSLRANLTTQLAATADLTVSSSFITQDSRIPERQSLSDGFIGTGSRDVNEGYALDGRPADAFIPRHNEELTRFTGSMTANWRPLGWLGTRATAGVDFSSTYYDFLRRKGESFAPFFEGGLRRNTKTNVVLYSADFGVTAALDVSRILSSNTSVGVQYNHRRALVSTVTAEQLTPGAETVAGGAIVSGRESTVESIIAGGYVEQRFGLNDRLFLTGAVRADGGSAFGRDFEAALYPKASLSWLLSEEPFWPDVPGVSSLRLRAAYGASGVQPGSVAALASETLSPALIDGELTTGAKLGALGNTGLKPERQREFEGGIDAAFLHGRLAVEATYYDKKSTDALVAVPLPGSIGGGSRFENVGSVRNWGYEALVNARILDRPELAWDVTLNGSINHNRLLTLGPNVTATYGPVTSIAPGYPVYSYFHPRILGYEDGNGNSIIEPSEVTVGDTPEFLGPSYPESQFTAASTLSLFENRLSLAVQLDYRGDFVKQNSLRILKCIVGSCGAVARTDAPFADQATAVAFGKTFWGFFEDGSFTRLRELSVTYRLPAGLVRRVGVDNASLVLSGRNLAQWSDYRSADPEANVSIGLPHFGAFGDNGGIPPGRYWTVRLNLDF